MPSFGRRPFPEGGATMRAPRTPQYSPLLVIALLLFTFLFSAEMARACGGCASGSCSSACRCGCGGFADSGGNGGGGGPLPTSGAFDAWNMELLSQRSLAQLSLTGDATGVSGSALWGWTDPVTRREYGIIGLSNTTSFLDVTDPRNPIFLGEMRTETGSSGWREMQTYRDHVFVVSDANGDHGMQVFDLTRLRGVTTPQLFTPDTIYRQNGFQSAHTITINTTAGFAILNSSNQLEYAVNIVDIRDPKSPTFLSGIGYPTDFPNHIPGIHDAQSVRYHGPDARYAGRDILIASHGTGIGIIDITDGVIRRISPLAVYPDVTFAHQGWLTEDQRYFISNDEVDEYINTFTRTHIWDFVDLTNPVYLGYYEHTTQSLDHNLFVKGNILYESNYLAGLRVFDLSNMETAIASALATRAPGDYSLPDVFTPIGHFDAHLVDFRGFAGSWHNYPYFDSGTILVSDIQLGVHIVRLTNAAAPEPTTLLLLGAGGALALWHCHGRRR
jgi:choice-of-anchor B domain-containing protein